MIAGEYHYSRNLHLPMKTFHILGLAHIPSSKEYSSCAYTQKVVNLCKMLNQLGHKVYLYCTEDSDVPDVGMITVGSRETRLKVYGDYDWRSQFFKHDPKDEVHLEFNATAISEILKRKQPRDFLLCPMGNYQKPIADAVGLTAVESGIGYEGVFSNRRVFESYAWMHYIYGLLRQPNGSWYDAVIPNSYDISDFLYPPLPKSDYYLFIGRLVTRKGLQVAIETTEKIGKKLVIAGQGSLKNIEGKDFSGYSHVEHIGTVSPRERFDWMSGAIATFVPTYYIEPFGGVAVESQLCGTPVITTDWGVFSETVDHGVTGYRCRTLDDFVWAANHASDLKPEDCRKHATLNYSIDRVKYRYEEYFNKLSDLWQEGWYEIHPDRHDLDWLRYY
jgi:glycosyltransferase involved in cell wall biosynthesis